MVKSVRFASVAFVSTLQAALCGCTADGVQDMDPFAEEDTASASQPMWGGSFMDYNLYNAVLYIHAYSPTYQTTGWVGLCSATYLGSVGGWAIATTAEHCLGGDESPFDNFAVSTDLAPGRTWDRPPQISPPPHLTTPAWVAGDWWAHPELGLDQAILQIPDDANFRSGLIGGMPERPGLTFMPVQWLTASTANNSPYGFSVHGYGKQGQPDDAPLGVLKVATNVAYVPSTQPYDLGLNVPPDATLLNGDSGGAVTRVFNYPDKNGQLQRWTILAGVTTWSAGQSAGAVAAKYVAEMVQRWLGHLVLSPMSAPQWSVVLGPNQTPRLTTDTALPIQVYYNAATKQLSSIDKTVCLDNYGKAIACNTEDVYQLWRPTSDLQLRNLGSSKCLDPGPSNGSRLRTVTCKAVAEQAWVFHVGTAP